MSNISKHLGLAGNVASLNSPEKWINFQSEVGSQKVTNVRLVSFGPSNVRDFSLEGTKRKRKDIDGDTISRRHPLVPVLQCSSNPPESSNRNSSTLSMVFSPYVADEEFSVNQDLNLQLKLDIEDAHIPKAHAFVPSHNLVSESPVNLELNLSIGPAISAITSEVGTPAPGFYISHGGGQRCENADCQNGAEGKTMHFQLHGGGLNISEGSSKFCIAHDGGRHCREVGCTTVSRDKSGLCIKHGGGRRCIKEECTKGAASGSGLCIAHGGGRRCYKPECTKGAQGSTMFCKAHGGGKRCSISDCGKGAEGSTPFCKRHGGGKRCLFQGGNKCSKSVRGGTQFCVAHGGGKRCANPECSRSARGRTDYCVRHGGGKRCQLEGCGKSAQGRTDFCKAHGGGKRCLWVGQADGNLCNRLSTGKVGLCAAHSPLVQDLRVHGGETMSSPTSQKPAKIVQMKMIAVDDSCLFSSNDLNQRMHPIIPAKPGGVSLTEGRVHGGSLMAIWHF
ncbi:hypothetical protein M5K25_024324 [Dendrobium thyrsiflorum]|uniref:WRKY19-like zinc finger domain-containing protein n=1 Tax=Dendrobium thyrsiflorum TaxID=117978 RepID=A0ABD0U1Y5_DENTH